MRLKRSYLFSLTKPVKIFISLGLMIAIFVVPHFVNAADAPSLDVKLRIASDGTTPFDATTYDVTTGLNGGTDANGTNRVVRVLDTMRYRAEVSVNGANQSNVVTRFTLDPDQEWQGIPNECLTTSTKPGINPSSSITDASTSGDKRVLICNIGDITQGTELIIQPTARVKGGAVNATPSDKVLCDGVLQSGVLDTTGGCVSAGATISSPTVSTVQSNFVSSITTANFKIDLTKEVPINSTTGYYQPRVDKKAGPSALGIGDGWVIEWEVKATARPGSERIKTDGSGKRDFVLTDGFIDNNPNNDVGLADGSSHANRSSNGRLYSWDNGLAGCEAMGTAIGSITCTQAGGDGSNLTDSGAPITITLNDVDVNYPDSQGQVFYFKLRTWIPIAQAAAPDNHDIMSNTSDCAGGVCALTLRNGIVGIDTPDPAIDGASPVITSITNQQNYGGAGEPGGELVPTYSNANPIGSGNNNFDAPVTSIGTGVDLLGGKSFYGNFFGALNPGTKTIARGQTVPTGLSILVQYEKASGDISTCDPIDTTQFTFSGTPKDGETHDIPQYQATPGGLWERYNSVASVIPGATQYLWDTNPTVLFGNSSNVATEAQIVPASQFNSNKIRLEYTDLAHSNALDDLRNFNCEDDINGDSVNDWVTDYESLPGGASSVTAVRFVWKDIDWDEVDALYTNPTAPSNSLAGVTLVSMYNLEVNATATGYNCPNCSPVGDYLANYGTFAYKPEGATTWSQSRAAALRADPNDVDFARQPLYADRLRIVGAKTAIQVELADISQKIANAGDEITFKVTPYLNGTSIPTDLSVAFGFPNTPSSPALLEYIGAEVDPSCATSNGTYGTFAPTAVSVGITINGVVAGQPVCPFLVTLRVPAGAPAGNYSAAAQILSNNAIINTDSQNPANGQAPVAGTSFFILALNAYQVAKENDRDDYEPNEAITQNLTYSNLGAENYTAGNFIDVLPFNGDGNGYTAREDTLTPDSTHGSQYTNNDGGSNSSSVGLTSLPTGTNGETFVYTTASPATIPLDPCHSANQPLGFVPTAGHYCYQAYVDNGNRYVDDVAAGTGLINWSASAPANLADVTAVRWTSIAHNTGQPARTVSLTLAPMNNNEGDLYCNNFSGRIPQISLDITSNDICERVVGGSITGTIFSDNNSAGGNFAANPGDGTYPGIQVQLLDQAGNPYDTDPVTPGVQPYIITTGANGQYNFTKLPSGTYQTTVLNPPTPDESYDLDDPSPPIPAIFTTPNNSGPVTLAGPATNPALTDVDTRAEVDFGYTGLASLAGKVWKDTNHNGQQDPGEPFVPNIRVHLLDANNNPVNDPSTGQPWILLTDSTGNFLFEDVIPGNYSVRFDLPANMTCTSLNQGPTATDSDGANSGSSCITNVILLLAGQNVVDEDLGLVDAPAPLSPNTGLRNVILPLVAILVIATGIVFGAFRLRMNSKSH